MAWVQPEDGIITPSTSTVSIEHLGFIIDSSQMMVSMTEGKTAKIMALVKKTVNASLVKTRKIRTPPFWDTPRRLKLNLT